MALPAPHLTHENVTDVLRRPVHKAKAQIQELVAQLRPGLPRLPRSWTRLRASIVQTMLSTVDTIR